MSEHKYNKARADLNINIEDVIETIFIQIGNPTEPFKEFSNIYSTAYEANLPLKQKVIKRNIDKGKSPWMTQCIAKSVMTKNKLCKTYLKNPSKRNGKNIKIN